MLGCEPVILPAAGQIWRMKAKCISEGKEFKVEILVGEVGKEWAVDGLFWISADAIGFPGTREQPCDIEVMGPGVTRGISRFLRQYEYTGETKHPESTLFKYDWSLQAKGGETSG